MRSTRARLAVVSVAAFGVVAALLTSSLAGGAAAAAASTGRPAAASPVLVSCAGQRQIRPSSFVLACADADYGVEHITWATWGSTAYAGTATVYMNDCDPSCASPHARFYHFPALITAWRAQPLPGHHGVLYFTRLSWIYTGKHCLPIGGGKTYCSPATGTFVLAPWPANGSQQAPA